MLDNWSIPMAGLLSSWWSGKPAEEEKEEGDKEKEEGLERERSSWVSGLEGKSTEFQY